MNNISQETLRSVTQDDPSLTELTLTNNNYVADGEFYSDNSDDYSALGAAIANNTYLKRLEVQLSDELPLTVADGGFYDGLKSNSSIHELMLRCYDSNIAGGTVQEILEAYQENSNYLTEIIIQNASLQNGGENIIVATLRSCRNLQRVELNYCGISDEQLLPIVDTIRGHCMLEELDLYANRIGNAGCETLATLLIDPNCNTRNLHLGNNTINNEGATAIANSLTNNNKLQKLYLYGSRCSNPIDQTSIQGVFSNILCNTTSNNSLYASNHTLKMLHLGQQLEQHLLSLLELNEDTNKSHVAMKKILQNHSNIDVESLFEWDAEGEQTLKALPYVINWFERTKVAIADDGKEFGIEERKLSAIFQFAKAMPLLLEGISRIKVDKKRKRSD